MAVHDGGGGAQADRVRSLDDVEPLRGRDLVGADDARTSSSRISAAVPGRLPSPAAFNSREECPHRDAERLRALKHLQRREGMDVDVGRSAFDRAADVEIGRAGVIRMDAALQADLGGAALPGLGAAALDFFERQVVRLPAQIG